MLVLGSIVLSLVLNYWIIIPTVPLAFIFIYVRRYFLSTSREMKRIESITRSPIYIHANNTISGMSIIRAANLDRVLTKEFYTHTDYHSRANSTFMYVNRWLSVQLGNLLKLSYNLENLRGINLLISLN